MSAVELTTIDEGVLQITFNRPAALNALTWELADELLAVLDRVEHDGEARVAVLTGAGRAFCAGFDLNGYGDETRLEELGVTRGLLARQTEISTTVTRLHDLKIPVIAAINGPCAGGGMSYAAACDIRIAVEGTVFSAAFLRAGVSACDLGVSWLLPRIVGAGRAQELLYTARRFDADEALSMGFVTDVVPADRLTAQALAIADRIKQNPPLQTELTKAGLSVALQTASLHDVVEFENRQQVLTAMTDDYREAIDSYLGKRTPRYTGR
ncbi:enoyl-CoA hydratase/isomerase family protein [Amycolatopsis sp. FDAARGOS 1241]|uniref:enoyl-CoA hydratase/isomerase family protein n=1 Tax=Amycolatopsis sp. FDAARGOS 1241 TaxID=2778070 RepID=UPI0019521389|nr:enoyl-CoA hydratase/isomerase family protein [Amycolatopsis sp. FDAARGOS 1241]QRP42846.1 enoyl-CoA hydratase/isomerase family protein [Amycolatopsis sp. FDAARGOS 1241]